MVNAGPIGAASADENMTINGNLSSNGRLQARKVEGKVANADTPIPVAPLLSVKGKVSGNTVTAEMEAANNLGTADAVVNDAFYGVKMMYEGMGEEKFQQAELQKCGHSAADVVKDTSEDRFLSLEVFLCGLCFSEKNIDNDNQ